MTAIFTELLAQDRINASTFLEDAKFRRMMQAPEVAKGYRVLVTLVVKAMWRSEWVSKAVATLSEPWAGYMKGVVEGKRVLSLRAWNGLAHGFVGLCGALGRAVMWGEG